MIIHERRVNGGEPEDGENNAIDVEFEAMNMEHEVDYDSTMADMFKVVKTMLYERCPTSHLATILL
jgi:hypothetical protein